MTFINIASEDWSGMRAVHVLSQPVLGESCFPGAYRLLAIVISSTMSTSHVLFKTMPIEHSPRDSRQTIWKTAF